MNRIERWDMYYEIHRLKQIGLKVTQISRRMDISRNTVYKYLNMTPEEVDQEQTRDKKLNKYNDQIVKWLKIYPDLSASQVEDWLKEHHPGEIEACESTVRNFVREIREKHNIPKKVHQRDYESVDETPMGQQMQVDFGVTKLHNQHGKLHKLWFIAFVLAHSRHKYVEWLNRPFTTRDVILAHENAFTFYGGKPREAVYDQDHLILVHENYGDLIFTQEFGAYVKKQHLRIYMCRKSDPESKGKIENVVKYVKGNFARNRIYYNLKKLNEDCLAWLERTGNGKTHHSTKKIPAQVFREERKHLLPVTEKIKTNLTSSLTTSVRKDNTVIYAGNRYSVPLGTYQGPESSVGLNLADTEKLQIVSIETGEVIATHAICHERGKLIKSNNHRRDRNPKIAILQDEVKERLNHPDADSFLESIREQKPRYIRDQLQLLKENLDGHSSSVIHQTLEYCIKNKLFSAVDFRDVLKHLEKVHCIQASPLQAEIQPLVKELQDKFKAKPKVRDLEEYITLLKGGNDGVSPAQSTFA